MNKGDAHTLAIDVPSEALAGAEEAASSRRSFATLLGALGALALAGCSEGDRSRGGAVPPEELDELQQALTGSGVLEVADTAANLRTITGGTTLWIAVLQGLASAGDGHGGVFYWSATAKADDGYSVLNSGSGNSAGWRRATGVMGELASVLATRVGLSDGELRHCSGVAAVGKGAGWFRWNASSTATAVTGMILGSGTGRWERVVGGQVPAAEWFGAVGDGASASADTAALAAMFAWGKDCYVGAGDFLVTGDVLLVPSGIELRGAGIGKTTLRSASGVTLELRNCSNTSVSEMTVECGASGSCVLQHSATGQLSQRNKLSRLLLNYGSGGIGWKSTVEYPGSGWHFGNTLEDVEAVGADHTGYGFFAPFTWDGGAHNQIGLTIRGGRAYRGLYGVDLSGCDFVIDGMRIDGVFQTGTPNTANTGRGIVTRSCNASVIKNVRFEDCDVYVQARAAGAEGDGGGGTANLRIVDCLGVYGAKFIDGGSATSNIGSGGECKIQSSASGSYFRHNNHVINAGIQFTRKAGATTLANGANVSVGDGANGYIYITGPTSSFSIDSVQAPALTNNEDGAKVRICYPGFQQITLRNQFATGTAAADRLRLPGGADIVQAGPFTFELSYDAGDQKWDYIGRP